MTIHKVNLNLSDGEIPDAMTEIIRLGTESTQSFHDQNRDHPVKGFHSSDFEEAYRWLEALKKQYRLSRFCEWGSGLAIVSLLADKLGFQSTAIEIDSKLHAEAVRLHDDHHSHCVCVHGSFVPGDCFDKGHLAKPDPGESMWLDFAGHEVYSKLSRSPDFFDVIYAYPWPGESEFIFGLFDAVAKPNAFLLSFHGAAEFQLHQKT